MTQVLPQDDAFFSGIPVYGSLACLYLGAKLSHTTPVANIWLGNNLIFVSRPMHGGYQSQNPATGVFDFNAAFHNSGSSTVRSISGMTFRRSFGADVTVSAIFEMRAFSGNPGLTYLAPRGVIARCAGGTIANDGTADVEYRDGTAYIGAVYQKSSDSTLRLGIIKVVSGVFSVLAGGESAALPTGGVDFKKLATVSLTVSGTGGTVSLTASVTGFGSTAVTSVSTTDSTSPITSVGRCGFMMGSDRNISGPLAVDLCHMLQVVEGGVVSLRDEFRRLSLAGSKLTASADLNGRQGTYLTSAFYWDAGTFVGTDVEGLNTFQGSIRLRRTGGAIDFDHQLTDDDVNAGRFVLSQRPAGNIFSHHRSITATIPSAPTATTGEVWVGLALRATQAKPRDQIGGTLGQGINSNPNVPAGTAYVFAVRAKTSTQVIWQLHRIVNNAHVPVARKTENSPFPGSNLFPGYGTAFTVELDVYPRNVADPRGAVEIVCRVDGTLVAFDTFLSPAGWTNPSTGKFVDASSTRIQSGFGEGIFLANGLTRSGTTANDIDPVLDDWTQGTLTNAAVDDQDQPSATLLPEPAAVGTPLNQVISPDTPLPIDYRSWHISNPFESGHRGSLPRYLKQEDGSLWRRKRVRCRKTGTRELELTALLAHFDAHKGLQIPFNATFPGYAAEKYRYVSDRVRHRMLAPDAFEVEFDLEGVG
ncbi:MAG TPA: hypothetical protein VLD67_13565 [Vicinamibacterales bacterium]|nr:hypothetical protein [Vicinamibacterales bacterium]